MPRIAGVDIPENKKVRYSLRYIYGVGPQTADDILKEMDIDARLVAFEIFLDAIPLPKTGKGSARPKLDLSPFQTVERDFAFVLDANVNADAVVRAAKMADKDLVTEVRVFDLFAGGAIGEGQKSLAISVVLQPIDATLTEADIEAVS